MSFPLAWRERSLMRQLLLWSLGALVIVWGCFVFLAYRTGVEEADELTDGHLASVAVLLLGIRDLPSLAQTTEMLHLRQERLKNHDYQQSFSVLVWDATGHLRWRIGDAPAPAFDAAEGYATSQAADGQLAWRSFSQWNHERTQKVAVMLLLEERDALADDIAGQMIEPGMWLLPVVALALGLAIARGLRPLVELSEEVAALDVENADSLVARHALREFDSVVNSINTLLGRQQQALQRERRFANEVAHELRTPLTSIVLQVQALEDGAAPHESGDTLVRIRKDALRAAHVLNQLLALARSSRAAEREVLQRVDLSQLARKVAADYASVAWERSDSIEVDAAASVFMQGQPVLLEMALRNLLENALRHTPHGTRIRVTCRGDSEGKTAWFQVCDDGQRSGAPHAASPPDSLHLGHEIVSRVATEHGAQWGATAALAPYTTCYRMTFPTAPCS